MIMGVINLTPDSFSDGGECLDKYRALDKATKLLTEGASVIDLGPQSTRPGANEIGVEEEKRRLLPALKLIRRTHPDAIISIDTFHSEVALSALEDGADWINDVTGGRRDPDILRVVSNFKCPFIITHSRGNSKNMDDLCSYSNVINELLYELTSLTNKAQEQGVMNENIIWDPGLGFAKTHQQNLEIIKRIEDLNGNEFPLILGPSRKRFIGHVLNEPNPSKRIWGSVAIACKCIEANVAMIRVHDVHEIFKTIQMAKYIWP